ncbi:hypothetical protein BDV93DRAFT_224162 [Ceratobasidium sp. AG-I]|nr:hypothetical protein BDV93DRAFT_224162 [Ceratobasidium sp. AG-I]
MTWCLDSMSTSRIRTSLGPRFCQKRVHAHSNSSIHHSTSPRAQSVARHPRFNQSSRTPAQLAQVSSLSSLGRIVVPQLSPTALAPKQSYSTPLSHPTHLLVDRSDFCPDQNCSSNAQVIFYATYSPGLSLEIIPEATGVERYRSLDENDKSGWRTELDVACSILVVRRIGRLDEAFGRNVLLAANGCERACLRGKSHSGLSRLVETIMGMVDTKDAIFLSSFSGGGIWSSE